MNAEIICWNTKDRIKISNNKGVFEQLSESNEKKYFFHLEKDIFKIIDTEKTQEDLYKYCIENASSYLILIVDEVNKENLNLINKVIFKKNFIVITGKIDLVEYEKYDFMKKTAILPQLHYDEKKINIISVILLIENIIKENKSEDYLFGSTIILGDKENEEPLGNIPLTILKNFNYIKEINCIELNICSGKEQSIQDIAYIKDPIMEYLTYDSVLKINQMVYDDINGKIYFELISK